MSLLRRLRICLGLSLALASATTFAAATDPGDSSEGVLLFFRQPSATEPALGEVAIEIEVVGESVTEVVFVVDGEEVGRATAAPYSTRVDFGDEFGPHRFEVIALGSRGELARAVRDTPGLFVDDRMDLELLQLYVTVEPPYETDARLSRGDFEVRDEGREQKVVTFEGGDAALTVALLIDSSESMQGGRLEAALAGARAFLSSMNDLDEASVVLFSDLLRSQTPYSQEPGDLEAELAGVRATGGTALNDALFVALAQLERRQGRRVVILLSDGFDIHSVLNMEDVLWSMRRSRSLVYWIELTNGSGSSGIASPWRSGEQHVEERKALRLLVEESGGRVVQITRAQEAASAFEDILAELRAQYVLGYYPMINLDDGSWHAVRVKVGKKGFKVRARGGYID